MDDARILELARELMAHHRNLTWAKMIAADARARGMALLAIHAERTFATERQLFWGCAESLGLRGSVRVKVEEVATVVRRVLREAGDA